MNVKKGYVIDRKGNVFVQIPEDNQWGFSIASDDQTWPGGIGIGDWSLIPENDRKVTPQVRESLQWILDEAE